MMGRSRCPQSWEAEVGNRAPCCVSLAPVSSPAPSSQAPTSIFPNLLSPRHEQDGLRIGVELGTRTSLLGVRDLNSSQVGHRCA